MKKILDACCGSRMFWFDKHHPDTLYIDNRTMEPTKRTNGATIVVAPDKVMDFRKLDLPDNSFTLIVFDPPHILKRGGKRSWMKEKYGELDRETWREDIQLGFKELFRVLRPDGVLIFKWSESDILVSDVLKLTPEKPLFGHRSGKAGKTIWLTFMKIAPKKENKTSTAMKPTEQLIDEGKYFVGEATFDFIGAVLKDNIGRLEDIVYDANPKLWDEHYHAMIDGIRSVAGQSQSSLENIVKVVGALQEKNRKEIAEAYERGLNLRKEYNDPELLKEITENAVAEAIERTREECGCNKCLKKGDEK